MYAKCCPSKLVAFYKFTSLQFIVILDWGKSCDVIFRILISLKKKIWHPNQRNINIFVEHFLVCVCVCVCYNIDRFELDAIVYKVKSWSCCWGSLVEASLGTISIFRFLAHRSGQLCLSNIDRNRLGCYGAQRCVSPRICLALRHETRKGNNKIECQRRYFGELFSTGRVIQLGHRHTNESINFEWTKQCHT